MDKEQYYTDSDWEEDDDALEIDWVGLLLKLFKSWKFIAVVCFAFTLLGVVVALMTPKQYTSTIILAPESQGKNGGGSLSSMASMLGLNTSFATSADALNVNLFPDISHSLPFLVQLFDVEVTPYVSEIDLEKGVPKPQPTSLARYILKDNEGMSLFERLKVFLFGESTGKAETDSLQISKLTPRQKLLIKKLQNMIVAAVDSKSGMINVSVTLDDPWIATTLVDTVCNRLQKFVVTYRTSKQQEDLDYYKKLETEAKGKMIKAQTAYALSVDYDRSVILQSVSSEKERLQQEAQLASQLYTQLAQQVEMAKAKLQEEKPVFTVLHPATMPNRPSSTSRKIVVLAFFFVGFCLSAGWKLFGEDFYQGFRNEIKARMDAENIENAQETNENSK